MPISAGQRRMVAILLAEVATQWTTDIGRRWTIQKGERG
jgi:hypothetical protein